MSTRLLECLGLAGCVSKDPLLGANTLAQSAMKTWRCRLSGKDSSRGERCIQAAQLPSG